MGAENRSGPKRSRNHVHQRIDSHECIEVLLLKCRDAGRVWSDEQTAGEPHHRERPETEVIPGSAGI